MPSDIDAGRARWQAALRRSRQARPRLHDAVRHGGRAALRADGCRRPVRAHRLAGRVPVHARHPRDRATAASRGRSGSSPASATPEQTNERYKMILAEGGGGLSVAFDMPTLMGRDSDDPRSLGEVGHCGVAIDSAADMDVLFERHRPGRDDHVDDDLRAGGPDLLHVRRGGRTAGRRRQPARTARCRPTSSRSTSRRRSGSTRRSRT